MPSLPRTSRRSFLKATLAAGAAPFFLPSGIWSAETKPNDRINIGFIGCGKMGHGHLGGLIGSPQAQLVAVCDVDTTRRMDAKRIVEEGYAKKAETAGYKGCDDYNDFREVLARKDIDAVYIVTPDHWHAPITVAAANAGKDIYCEKPLCQTVHESAAMVAAVRRNNRIFQTGSQQRSSKEFRVACELVRNGIIGKVSRVEAGFGGPPVPCDLPEEPAEPGLDWNMWLGPAPMRPYNSVLAPRGVHNHFPDWRKYREYGGGLVTDWGAHHIDISQWGLGVDADGGPVEVIPPADWKTAQHGVRLIYPGGVELTHIPQNGVFFHGSEGVVRVNRGIFRLTLGGEDKAKFTEKTDTPALKEQIDRVEKEYLSDAKVQLYRSNDHRGDWLGAIRSRKDPICPVEVGTRTVNACHLMNFAYLNGKQFKWDAAKQTFADGTGDPKWLTREYRGEWRVS